MSKVFNPEQLAKLDSPDRLKVLPPAETLTRLGLKAGMVFTDIGCGTGTFTLPASTIVGEKGTVYAADIEPLMLQTLSERISSSNYPSNIHIIHSGETLPVPAGVSDFILISFVIHEAEKPESMLRDAAALMKKGAKIIIIDWAKIKGDQGPPLSHRISSTKVKKLLKEADFKEIQEEKISDQIYTVSAII